MRIRRRFFSVFMAVLLQAVLLTLPRYIALAEDIPPEFTGGESVAAEQTGGFTDGISEAENPPETEGEDASENKTPPYESNSKIISEQADEGSGSGGPALYGETSPVFIDSQDAFEEWVDTNSEDGNVIGGSITLGSDITINKHILLSGPLSIDTGAYGLTMDGGSVHGPLSITGDGLSAGGVPAPVLTVVNMYYSPWDKLLSWYNVTARGRNGKGGIAVRVSTSEDGSPGFIEAQGLIRSEGEGAVGVEFVYPVEAYYLSVSVEGKNSVAVSAPDGASLYYSRLAVSGDGSIIASGGNILLDTCKISGDAGHVDVVSRKIIALAGTCLYWPLAQGQEIVNSYLYRTFYAPFMPPSFLLSGDGVYPPEVRMIPTQWNQDEMDGVDTSVLGKTIISAELNSAYQGLGLEDDFSLDLTIDVQESGKPCIVSLKFGDDIDTGRHYVYLRTNDLDDDWFELKDGNFILWRSDDEGESWDNTTDSPDISLDDGDIAYFYDKITSPVWFCIQEIDGDYSNIAVIYGYEGKTCGSLNGDRTGVDRGGESPVATPAPESGSAQEPDSRQEPDFRLKPAPPSGDKASPPSLTPTPDIAIQTSVELILPPSSGNPASAEGTSAANDTSGSDSTLPDEWENDTASAISGRRLRMMMDAGDKVTIIKKGLRLSFDASSLEALGLGDGQLFTVTVLHLGQLEYMVTVALDGTELYDLPCAATLDGNTRDILVSGTYNFAPVPDGEDAVQAQTHHDDAQPLQTPEEDDSASVPAVGEEIPDARTAAVFVLSGAGCAAGAVFLVRYRVKRYDR